MAGQNPKKRKSRSQAPPFVFLNGKTLWSDECRQLLPSRQVIYLTLKARYNGQNNGRMYFPYTDFEDQYSKRTFYDALTELETKGWIHRVRKGGKYRFHYRYALTGRYDEIDRIQKPFVGIEKKLPNRQAWKELSDAAKVHYLLLKCSRTGWGEGDLSLPYSKIKGVFAYSTSSKARKELIAKGWLEKAGEDGGLFGVKRSYKLTRRYDLWPSKPSLVYGKYIQGAKN